MRLLTALTAILGVLSLTVAASAQVINGCVKDKNGALRIVIDPADCTTPETPNETPPTTKTLRSELDTTGVCLGVSREDLVVPVKAVDLGLTFPLPAPLYVGLAPEAGP